MRSVLLMALVGSIACATPPPRAVATGPRGSGTPAIATASLTVTYLGVAGWELSDGTHTVLSDPYFSRPSFAAEVPIAADPAAIAARAPARADVVVIGHSHVDHVLDAPAVARRTGASIIGTISTANYARAAGVPDQQIIPVKGGEDYAFDGFSVRVLPGLHSALDDKRTFGADQVIAPGTHPTTMAQFAEGGTLHYLVRLGGRQILIIGSANFIERELTGLRPDIAIVATGLRHEIYDYSCRLMRALGHPPVVLTNHFDAWTRPPDEPLSADTLHDLAAFAAEIHACSPTTRVIVPKHFEAMQM
jgi:L-ascorbate metabolism protein UlaG (beta-lactamase superfamily)